LIHFSESHAKQEGHRDILVQRGLLGNFLANQMEKDLGGFAEIRRLSWRVLSSAYPNQTLICQTKVTKKFARDGKNFLRTESSICDHQGRLIVQGDGDLELNSTCF
jgi:hydroxyacyl-ACP dehydratase HTD2-like protein with hotdog domain